MTQSELTDYIRTHLLDYYDNNQDLQEASFYLAEKLLPLIIVKKEKGRFLKTLGKIAEIAVPIIVNNKKQK